MGRARLVVLLAALAGVVAFVLPAGGGRPMLDFAEVRDRLFAAGPHFRSASDGSTVAGEGGGGVYKWQDDDGTWHFSNVRPEGRRGVQKVKETVTWAKGSGASAPRTEGNSEPGQPRSAAELLAESKRLEEKTGARESELQKLVDEAAPE